MSAMEATGQSNLSAEVVDQEYEKLKRYHIDYRRIVLADDREPPEGGFGIVRRAKLHPSAYLPVWLASRRYGPPQLVAVKQIKVTKMSSTPRVKRAFTREMLVWSSLEEHPGISKFLGFYADFENSKAWLLSPWEPNGNVNDFVKARNLEVPEKLSLIYDTIDALTFLHQRDPPVCHGDIKGANVLVGADYKARLCDFGLARLHEDSGLGRLETSSGMKGSIRWCSPEILNGAPREPTSDVYAWAWLVWEIMTGKIPYEETTADFVIMRQIFESLLPQVHGEFCLGGCLQVWELMTRCWNGNPVERPTARMCKTTITRLPRCTPTSTNADPQTQSAALLENLGDLESWKGNQEKSAAYFDQALRLYQEDGDTRGLTSVLLKQAAAAERIYDLVKLRALATTALEHCRTLNDASGMAKALFYIAFSAGFLDEVDEALPMLQESLEIRRTHGDDVGVVECLERISDTQRSKGLMKEALSTLEEATEIASRSGDRLGLANVLHAVGLTHTRLSNFAKATETFSEAIMITRNVGWEGELTVNLYSMAGLKSRLGEDREAEELLQESISVARRIGSQYIVAEGLEELGDCFIKQSKLDEAAPVLEEAFQLYQDLSRPRDSKRIASALADLKSDRGDWDRALFWHDRIIAMPRGQDDLELADDLQRKGRTLVKVQRYDEAALHFEAFVSIYAEKGYSRRWWLSQLCAIPKTAMEWDRPLCDVKRQQRRLPQLITAVLNPPTPVSHAHPYPCILDLDR